MPKVKMAHVECVAGGFEPSGLTPKPKPLTCTLLCRESSDLGERKSCKLVMVAGETRACREGHDQEPGGPKRERN